MSSAYQVKPWTQVVTPHLDILEGRLDSSTYAASLGAVVRQDSTCPKREFDPTWIRNAVEEPLDEMDIQASTRLE